MDTMLQDILINTYNPDHAARHQAEEALKEYLHNSGAFYSLLEFVKNSDANRDLRLAASIVLKNNAKSFWRTDEDVLPISPEEKESSKAVLLDVMLVEQDSAIRSMLAETVRTIAGIDYPDNWPQLLPTILANISNSDILRMYNALFALRKVVKIYEFKHKEARLPLDNLIQAIFPTLQELMTQILENNSIEAAQVMRVCLKIFWSSTQYALPNVQGVDVNLWFHILGQLLDKKLPEASEGLEPSGQPQDIEERNNWPWWKVKKWTARIITHFIQRYGNPQYAGKEYKAFATHFRQNTAIALLTPVMNTLMTKTDGGFITDHVHRLCITYICNSVEMSPTYKVLKPHLDYILFSVIMPTLCLSKADVALFEDDPQEFIRKVHNPLEDWLDPRIAATNLLQMMARYRLKDTLPKLLPHIQTIFDEYAQASPETKDVRAKEGALVALASVSKVLMEKKPYKDQLEGLLATYVLPDMQSPAGVLRARVCWLLEHFCEVDWKQPSTMQTIVHGLLQCLRDPDLPVQGAAACAFRLVIQNSAAQDIIRPVLFEVINEYFRIMAEIENDVVLGALQSIVLHFGEEINDIAPLIMSQLLNAFEGYSSAGEDDDEAAFSATQCLDTMATVVEVCKNDAAAIAKLEELVAPLLYRLFASGDDAIEYVDNAIELIGLLSYYPEGISDSLWQCFGPMLQAVDEWAYDYMMEFVAPLTNFIAKGTGVFLQGSSNGKSFLDSIMALCRKSLEHDTSELEREAKAAATLLNCVVVCCKGAGYSIDPVISIVMELVIARVPHCRTSGLRTRLLCTAMGVVVYNPEAACQFYVSVPEVEALIFENLFSSLPRVFKPSHQQVCIAAFCSLLSLPVNSLPPYVRANVQAIMSFTIRLISLLEENEEDEGGEDEESELGGEYEDDDEDAEDNESNIARTRAALRKYAKHAIPEEGYDEDEDCLNAEDEAYLEAVEELDKLDRVKKELKGDEDFDDDENDDDFTSPLDNTDMLLQFCDVMNSIHSQNPEYINHLQANLDENDQSLLQEILNVAEMRRQHSRN